MSSQFKRLTKVLARSFNLDSDGLVSSFRLARLDEIPQVSALRRRVFGNEIKKDDEKYLQWRYFDRKDFPPTLWVFEYNKQIIAALGTEPVELWHDGGIETALRNMDAIVEPKYDSRGLGAWMTLAIQERNNCVLVTGGNDNSTSMLNKLFTALPVRKNFKIILRSRNYLEGKVFLSYFSGIASFFLDFALTSYLHFRWISRTLPENFSLVYFNDVDELLKLIEDPVGCLAEVKVVRTRPYLKWLYVDKPGPIFWAVGVLDEGKLLAYAIYNIEDGKDSGSIRAGKIIDWNINLKANAIQILASMFIAVVKNLKKRGVDEVFMVLNDSTSHQAATAAGFVYRNVESSFFVYHNKLPENSKIFSADAWYQSLGDSDIV